MELVMTPRDPGYVLYSPTAANWSLLTMGSFGVLPIIGAASGSDLVGNITGFGFVATDGSDTGGNETIQFDQLTITGTAVPEPASLGLLALAGAALGRRRR